MAEKLFRAVRCALVSGVVALGLCSCGGSSNPSPTPSSTPCGPGGSGQVYLTDVSGNNGPNPDTILALPIAQLSCSTITPSQVIQSTPMTDVPAIAADHGGNTYVANQATATILEFNAGANGPSVPPLRTINSSSLSAPYGIAVDASGNIFVADPTGGDGNGAIDEFSASQNGNVTPVFQITGPGTGLAQPYGVAVDAGDNIYVANDTGAPTNPGNPSVEVFLKGSTVPARTITGSATGLNVPLSAAVDAPGNMYVVNVNGNSVTVYGSTQTGNVAPIRTIAGPATIISIPQGVALDSSGKLYVTNLQPASVPGSLNVFAPGANGDVAPSILVCGPGAAAGSCLNAPSGVAI
jgi:hypothetical protein